MIVAGCLVLVAMWVYYFFFASGEGVYQIQDRTWRPAALEVCAAADRDLASLADTSSGFITQPTAQQMRERAQLVDASSDVLETMVTDLVAIPVDNEKDRLRLDTFAANYRLVIADRRRYADELRAGNDVDYTETVVGGGPVSNVVADFTAGVKGNNIPLCTPPGDLALTINP